MDLFSIFISVLNIFWFILYISITKHLYKVLWKGLLEAVHKLSEPVSFISLYLSDKANETKI